MSIRVMTQVWEAAPVSGNELLMLLALADNANDQGIAWPSVGTLAHKTRIDERTARRVLRRLATAGHLEVTGKTGRVNRYRLRTEAWTNPDPGRSATPGETPGDPGQNARGQNATPGDSPRVPAPGDPGQQRQGTPGTSAPLTINEPSREPSGVCDSPARASVADGQEHTHPEAVRIVDGWVSACPAAKGQPRRAVLAVVGAALDDGIEPELIAAALVRVAGDGFLVTERTLAVALAQHASDAARRGLPSSGGIEPSRNALILAEARRRAEAAERAAAEGGQGFPGVA